MIVFVLAAECRNRGTKESVYPGQNLGAVHATCNPSSSTSLGVGSGGGGERVPSTACPNSTFLGIGCLCRVVIGRRDTPVRRRLPIDAREATVTLLCVALGCKMVICRPIKDASTTDLLQTYRTIRLRLVSVYLSNVVKKS